MFNNRLKVMAACAIFVAGLGLAAPSFAQTTGNTQNSRNRGEVVSQTGTDNDNENVPTRDRRQRRQTRPAPPTPEQNKAAAQALLTATPTGCEVQEARSMGETADTHLATYEASCSNGQGYIVVAASPPATYDCLELASAAIMTRERDPNATIGQLCAIPANADVKAMTAALARNAGIDCTVDQGMAVGKTTTDERLIVEVGCANQAGYMLDRNGATWEKSSCFLMTLQGRRCRFTTAEEHAAAWKTFLAPSPASACDYAQGRTIGIDASRTVLYEIKCAAGDGWVVRVAPDGSLARVQTCAEAGNVGGGCTLGTTPAVLPAPAPSATQPPVRVN